MSKRATTVSLSILVVIEMFNVSPDDGNGVFLCQSTSLTTVNPGAGPQLARRERVLVLDAALAQHVPLRRHRPVHGLALYDPLRPLLLDPVRYRPAEPPRVARRLGHLVPGHHHRRGAQVCQHGHLTTGQAQD